jgi:hypothetical protein
MDCAERLSGRPDHLHDERARQKPEAMISCSVCADTARIYAVRVQHGQCTMTYRCIDCGHSEDRILP